MSNDYGFRSSDNNKSSGSYILGGFSLVKISIMIMLFVLIIWKLATMVVAGFIAWKCFAGDIKFVRTVKTIVAIIFSNAYLLLLAICSLVFGFGEASNKIASFDMGSIISFFKYCC